MRPKFNLRLMSYKYLYQHRVKTTMKMILVAVTTIFWVSMMNKFYYGCQFWYVAILFSSNKLLKLKYIHYFFSKISNEKIMVWLMGWEIQYLFYLFIIYLISLWVAHTIVHWFPKCRSQRTSEQFPGILWIHFCNGYFDIYL
jgi:hypothetical protein